MEVDYNECQICGLRATTSNEDYSNLCSLCAACEKGPPMTYYDIQEEAKKKNKGRLFSSDEENE